MFILKKFSQWHFIEKELFKINKSLNMILVFSLVTRDQNFKPINYDFTRTCFYIY